MNVTYQELARDMKIIRYRGFREARSIIRHAPERTNPWSIREGLLVIESDPNDIVIRFESDSGTVRLDVYERVVRKTMDGKRMHDDRCRPLFRGSIRKGNLAIRVTEDNYEKEQLERKRTLSEFHRYEHLLDPDEIEEFRSAYDGPALTEHRKRRTTLFRESFRMIDAMNRYLEEEGAVETRLLVHKRRRFSPVPERPSGELYSIRRSFVRRLERKGQA